MKITINIKLFFFILSIFINCAKNKYPDSISTLATYDKKSNSYILIKDNIKTVWNEKGQIFSETNLDELGRENGTSKTFFPETGALLSVGNFKNGEREGIWEWYFPDGKIYYRSGYSPDKKRQVWIATNVLGNEHGTHERYYDNGKIEERGTYEFGLKVGRWEKYFKNGKQEHFGTYSSDKKIGIWVYLYPNGNKVAEEKYDENGKLINRTTFYPNGKEECIVSSDSRACNEIIVIKN
jgi:antitoxin component YwqK of YwqJK toxin-antitoxin module